MKLFREKANRFKAISLVYRAPVLPEIFATSPASKLEPPSVFYNAFPDLNDQAMDGSYSAYPVGAKYSLPLACDFNPYETYKMIDDRHRLTTHAAYQRLKEISSDSPNRFRRFALPREPELELEFTLNAYFEATHHRLAAVPYKLMFRANLLGPFYDTLWEWLFSKHKIRVPLVPAQRGSKLKRQWDQITDWLLGTTVLDETCSLLVTLAIIPDKEERNILEAFWVMAEDKEMQGTFIPFYNRFRLATEKAYGGRFDSCVTENELLTFAEVAQHIADHIYYVMACNGISDAAEIFKSDGDSPYPDDEEVVKSFLEQLGNRIQTISIGSLPAALGVLLSIDERERSLTDELKFGPEVLSDIKAKFQTEFKEYGRQRRFTRECFICETEILKNGTTCFKITPSDYLREFLYAINANDEGNSDQVMYTIFLESMRQQICQGVGLRCPFWDGECCRSDIRALLKTLYERTEPWLWPQHWQKPPCLE